jgi:hypothetical protein
MLLLFTPSKALFKLKNESKFKMENNHSLYKLCYLHFQKCSSLAKPDFTAL